jgi:hypothetical protein
MADTHIVDDDETLFQIAKSYGFKDGGKAIWAANPQYADQDPNVLLKGWQLTIPDKSQKDEGRAVDGVYANKVPRKKLNLKIQLKDEEGNDVSGDWQYRFLQGNGDAMVRTIGPRPAPNGKIEIEDIDPDTPDATLELTESRIFGLFKTVERVQLEIGGLDPIVSGPAGIQAVQKLLFNLGYNPGKPDALYGPKTNAAVRAFRKDYMPHAATKEGIDSDLCTRLREVYGCRFGVSFRGFARAEAKQGYTAPLNHVAVAEAEDPESQSTQPEGDWGYEEPTENEQQGPGVAFDPDTTRKSLFRELGKLQMFPSTAYVAPWTENPQQHVNSLRKLRHRFIFLDAGNFYSNHTNFAVIWGCHVYLCDYFGGDEAAVVKDPADGSERLDALFFDATQGCAIVKKRAVIDWAPESDFDWSSLYLIIPDMHMMTAETAKFWHAADEGEPPTYDFDVERKLRGFARTLATAASMPAYQALQTGLRVVQIGDSYDLWINCEPRLYEQNESHQLNLVQEQIDPVPQIARWVKEIQQSSYPDDPHPSEGITPANPAVEALRLLDHTFGGTTYIVGNHDDYLIREEVCAEAGITGRQRWLELPGVFVEHGHRLEGTFQGLSFPVYNYDGATSGWKEANKVYRNLYKDKHRSWEQKKKGFADWWARRHDQPEYRREYAQMWLGRQISGNATPPHLFVIGHTHVPNIFDVKIGL